MANRDDGSGSRVGRTVQRWCFLLVAFGLWTMPTEAKEWRIESIRIEAQVDSLGRVLVTEHREYAFDGSYSYAYIDIRNRGFDRLSDVRVVGADSFSVEARKGDELLGAWTGQHAQANYARILWHFDARDTTRTFTLAYILEGAIVKGPEYSELFWWFVGDDFDRSHWVTSVALSFEGFRVGAGPLYAFTYPNPSLPQQSLNGQLTVDAGRVHGGDGLRIRTVFPSAWIPGYLENDPLYAREPVLAEEADRAAHTAARLARQAWYSERISTFLVLGIVFNLLILTFFYQRYGRRHAPAYQLPARLHEPPSDLHPALAQWLVGHRTPTMFGFLASLLDLSRRGLIVLDEQAPPTDTGVSRWKKKSPSPAEQPVIRLTAEGKTAPLEPLLAHDALTLSVLRDLADEDFLYMSELWPTSGPHTNWYLAWLKAVKEEAKALDYFDARSQIGLGWSIVLNALLGIAGFFLAMVAGGLGLVLTATSIVSVACSFFILRWTPSGQEAHARWKTYRKSIKEAVSINPALLDKAASRHLIYAVAFGFTSKKFLRFAEGIDRTTDDALWMTHGMLWSPTSFNATIATTAAVSSGGAGGGAAAGAAGGGGGGGAG